MADMQGWDIGGMVEEVDHMCDEHLEKALKEISTIVQETGWDVSTRLNIEDIEMGFCFIARSNSGKTMVNFCLPDSQKALFLMLDAIYAKLGQSIYATQGRKQFDNVV